MEKYKILDKSGGRKIHSGYTAHMGGIVILIGFVASFCFSLIGIRYLVSIFETFSLLILLVIITIIGIRDDMNNLSPTMKLICEIIIGLCLCALNVRIISFGGFLGIYTLPVWLSYVLTIFFFIVVSNAYNLIDGIDGQAGLQAIATFGAICIFLWQLLPIEAYGEKNLNSPFFWLMIIAAMLGSIVGFLIYNWQKARIFMGDTGSLFIGFMIGISIIVCMNLNTKYNAEIFDYHIKSNLCVILCLFFLPLADTLRVFILRVRKGKSPLYPDKTHIHHLLLRVKGLSHMQCAITTFFIEIITIIIMSFLSFFLNDNWLAIVIFIYWLIYVFGLKFFVKENIKHNNK
ncbi:MAG: undecaprenyl/decaprenyl-phosphate alpha-N-acetylglucosaminyl 1-phosphate transferase [Bacteroidales bacterium]|nr:undecaprenyl/decaprenyl-phosphate alpha-N-acetylglucosaminyl 1-phosphate transferase [Bacteroidales bacterium]